MILAMLVVEVPRNGVPHGLFCAYTISTMTFAIGKRLMASGEARV
jgi:hypothetical protein